MSDPNVSPEPVSPAEPSRERRLALLPGYLSLAIIAIGAQTASVKNVAQSEGTSTPAYFAQRSPYGDPLMLPRELAEAHLPSHSDLPLLSPPFDDRLPEDRPLSTLLPPSKPEAPQAEANAATETPAAPAPGSGYIGPTYGFNWNAQPLPAIGPGAVLAVVPRKPAPTPRPAPSPNSSELPNEQVVAVSRLANPQLEVRGADVKPVEVTAEKPLGLRLSVARPEQGYQIGDLITAQVNATSPCYAALVRVDATGKAMLVFQSVRPTRQFSCALKAGPNPGAEYLLVVASAHPLNGTELAALLKSSNHRFPAVARATGTDQSGAAWKTALDYLSGLRGPQHKLQRHEWAVATTSFATQAAAPATAQAAPAKPSAPPKPKAATAAGKSGDSVLPTAPAATPSTSVLPAPEPAAPAATEQKPQPVEKSDESTLPE